MNVSTQNGHDDGHQFDVVTHWKRRFEMMESEETAFLISLALIGAAVAKKLAPLASRQPHVSNRDFKKKIAAIMNGGEQPTAQSAKWRFDITAI